MKHVVTAFVLLISVSAFSQLKISQMPSLTGGIGTNTFLPTERGGINYKLRADSLLLPLLKKTDTAAMLAPYQHWGLYVPLARTITINGQTQTLNANRTWNITNGVNPENGLKYLAGGNLGLGGRLTQSNTNINFNGNTLQWVDSTRITGDYSVRLNAFGPVFQAGVLGDFNNIGQYLVGLSVDEDNASINAEQGIATISGKLASIIGSDSIKLASSNIRLSTPTLRNADTSSFWLQTDGAGRVRLKAVPTGGGSSTNIGNSNLTLTGNRVLNGNNFSLQFDSTSEVHIHNKYSFGRKAYLDINNNAGGRLVLDKGGANNENLLLVTQDGSYISSEGGTGIAGTYYATKDSLHLHIYNTSKNSFVTLHRDSFVVNPVGKIDFQLSRTKKMTIDPSKITVFGNSDNADGGRIEFDNGLGGGNAKISGNGWRVDVDGANGAAGIVSLNKTGVGDVTLVVGGGKTGVGTATPSEKLHVVGNILASGTITPSDRNFKRNIIQYNGGLKSVMALRPVTYNYNTSKFPDKGFDNRTHIGLIAQEVKTVLPQTVTEYADGKGVNYTEMIPVLISAIQELKAEVDALKAQLKARK